MKGIKMILTVALFAVIAVSCKTTSEAVVSDVDNLVFVDNGVNVEMLADEADFVEALVSVAGTVESGEMADSAELTLAEAVAYTVSAANMSELAWTFPVEKTSSLLASYEVAETGIEAADQLAAAALTVGLIDADWYAENLADGVMSNVDMRYLLEAVIAFNGITIDYLGMVSDDDIYAEILEAWDDYAIVQNNALVDIVDEGVIRGITTGYNVVKTEDNCGFDPELMINYGHSNIKHAIQLVALLKSEGLDAKVDYQGKTSAFLYLEEWGTPYESESFKVKQIPSGNYVAYSKEYNIYFEFENTADKARFNEIILAYAKKDSADEPGLIHGSWWQPLYSSLTEMGDGYRVITDNIITYGDYEAHPFSLNEQSEAAVNGFLDIDPSLDINSQQFWVNQAFFNYIGGEDFK